MIPETTFAGLFESAAKVTTPFALVAFALGVVVVGGLMWRKGRGAQWAGLCVIVIGATIAIFLTWQISSKKSDEEKNSEAQVGRYPDSSSTVPNLPTNVNQTSHGKNSPNVNNVGGNVNITSDSSRQ
jgi:hypothetical protein